MKSSPSPFAHQTLARLLFALSAAGLSISAIASDKVASNNGTNTANAANTTNAAASKKAVKAKSTKLAKNSAHNADIEVTEPEPNVDLSDNTEYKCELGNSLVMYAHPEDNQSIAMRWRNRLYKLTRVETSTGAHRYENQKLGLLWINIPSKGMLLDSRRGHQLANECKSTKIASLGSTETQLK